MRALRPVTFVLLIALLIPLLGPSTARAQDRWLGPDKVLHFVASFVITSAAYAVARESWEWDHTRAQRFGATAGLLAGVAKEAWDGLSGTGDPSGKDLIWDLAGVGFGLVFNNQVRHQVGGPLIVEGASAARIRPPLDARVLRVLNGIDSIRKIPTMRLPGRLSRATSSVG